MILIGILNGVVDICVSIRDEQFPSMGEMYPDHTLVEQVGAENIGWAYDGLNFTAP